MLVEDKVQWLKDTVKDIDTSHDDLAQHHEPHDIIDHFAAHDPHPKKQYTPWMVKQYKQQNIRQEDAHSVGETLSNFEKYKGKLEKKDINQYKHPHDVAAAVQPHLGQAPSKKQEKKGAGALIHDAGGIKVFKVNNQAEATHFSKEATRATGVAGLHSDGTAAWCTVAPNMFKHYTGENNEKPLYVVHTDSDKDLHKRYQFHFETNQFADARDKNLGAGEIAKRHPELHNVSEFRGKHPTFDEPENVAKKAMNDEKYPGGQRAFHLDASSGKPVLNSKQVEEYWHKHAKGETDKTERYHKFNSVLDHPNTPSHVVDEVANHPMADSSHAFKIAAHPNISENSFRSLLNKHDKGFDRMRTHVNLASNPGLKTHHLEHIANSVPSDEHETHEALASNPNTSRERLHSYALGSNFLAFHNALENPSTHHDTFDAVYHSDHTKHDVLATSSRTPEHILHKFVQHSETGASPDHPDKTPHLLKWYGEAAANNLKSRRKKGK